MQYRLMSHPHLYLDLHAAEGTPEWIHLLPAGSYRGVDGRGPYRTGDPEAIIAASMRQGKLALDENHATDLASPRGEPAPARGWITTLEARADGIWGRVDWNESGRQLMADRAYRGISPVLVSRHDGTVIQILRASLVNAPNFPLKTLHAQETIMDLMSQLRSALQLDNDADDQAVLAAVSALTKGLSTQAQLHAAVGVASDADGKQVLAAIQQLRERADAAVDANKNADTLANQVVHLQSQISEITRAAKRQAAEAAIDAAVREGKPLRALRDHYITRHMSDAAAVETEIKAMPSINDGGLQLQQQAKKAATGMPGPDASHDELMASATKLQKEFRERGVDVSWHQAVSHAAGLINLGA
jgi:phage I-like protein